MMGAAERLLALAAKYDAFKLRYRRGSDTFRWWSQHVADLRLAAAALIKE